jgi:hypothetical protein
MHAKNIENLLRQIRYYDFEYVLLLDNDVWIKHDFVSHLVSAFPDCDLFGTYFIDLPGVYEFTQQGDGISRYGLPRLVPAHLLMSRFLYDKVMEDTSILYPHYIEDPQRIIDIRQKYELDLRPDPEGRSQRPIFVDTFGEVFHKCKYEWGMKIATVPNALFDNWAHHFYSSSFNYGSWSAREKHKARLDEIEAVFNREFPFGLSSLNITGVSLGY